MKDMKDLEILEESGFGFWFYNNKIALEELERIEDVLIKEKLDYLRTGKFGFEFNEKFENEDLEDKRIEEVRNIMLNNNIEEYVIYRNR